MADVNAQTGEPQNASGWSTDGGDDASAKAAKALTVDSPMSKQYLGRMDAITSDMQANFAKQQEAESPYRDKLMKILESPQAAEAHLEKVKEAPKPEDYQKYSMEFASAMAVIGAIGGKWTRNVGNSSLNAFAGALKGWQSGNQEAYENAAKEWQQNTQKTLENNRAEMEKYHEIINNKKLNIDQMMAAMNLVSSEYQNKIMFDATMAKNYTMAFSAADKMEMAQAKLQGTFDKLESIRQGQEKEAKGKIDFYNNNPDALSRLSDTDYAKLAGAAEKFGMPLKEKPATPALPPGWTEDSMNYQADLYNKTGQLPGFGMGAAAAQIRSAVVTRAAERALGTGQQPGDIIVGRAEQKSLGMTLTQLEKQKAAIDAFENTAKANGRVLEQLADKVDQTGRPVIERWLRAGKREVAGDVDVNNFNAQVNLYAAEVAKIVSNPNMTGVLSDTARHEAQSFLAGDASAKMIHSVVRLLDADMDRRNAAIEGEITAVQDKMRGGGKAPTQGGAPAAPAQNEADPLGIRDKRSMSDEQPDPVRSGGKYAMADEPGGFRRQLPEGGGGGGGGFSGGRPAPVVGGKTTLEPPPQLENSLSEWARGNMTTAQVKTLFNQMGWSINMRQGRNRAADFEVFDPSGNAHYLTP